LATSAANSRTLRVVAAIQPRLADWAERGKGGISFRTTQVMTGHRCFGEYLCWIERERTTRCHHCGTSEDTAHTLEECPAWADERSVLVVAVGRDLSLPAIIDKILGSERSWRAVVHFCEAVISQKEDHERARRGEDGGARRGRRQGGGNRSAQRDTVPRGQGPMYGRFNAGRRRESTRRCETLVRSPRRPDTR